jgi:uncharacterized protein YrrD
MAGETRWRSAGGDPVHATDDQIGQIRGVAMDHDSRHMSHLLLKETGLLHRKHVAREPHTPRGGTGTDGVHAG